MTGEICLNKYQLWLGGSKNLQRLAKPYLQRMPLEKMESTLTPLLLEWRKYYLCKYKFKCILRIETLVSNPHS